jgi:hypothetical protein
MSASGGSRTASSACSARPPVWAAWKDVPQPVWATRAPSGRRRSVGTRRSHSGCSVCLVCHGCVYTIAAVAEFPWIEREHVRAARTGILGYDYTRRASVPITEES